MREIKFRIWDIISKSFYLPERDKAYITLIGEPCRTEQTQAEEMVFPIGYRSVIQQWTGLKDKNGTEIYEGDILQYRSESIIGSTHSDITENIEVKFEDGAFLTKLELLGNGLRRRDMIVIGNIYENPDLLTN